MYFPFNFGVIWLYPSFSVLWNFGNLFWYLVFSNHFFFCRRCFNSRSLVVNLRLFLWLSLVLNIKHSINISDLHSLTQWWTPGTMLSHAGCKLCNLILKSFAFSVPASLFYNKILFWDPYISAIILEGSLSFTPSKHSFSASLFSLYCLHHMFSASLSCLTSKLFLQFMIWKYLQMSWKRTGFKVFIFYCRLVSSKSSLV